jgi:predicted ATPase
MDEPELGLHPAAIQKLAALVKMAEAKSQIILSTQSVNLLEHFEPENIIVVDRAQKQSVFKRLNTEDLKHWIDDYNLGELWRKNVIGGTP